MKTGGLSKTDGTTGQDGASLPQRLQDNSPTNRLAVSQVADWITRGLVNSPTANFKNHGITILYLYIKPNPNPYSNPIDYWQGINSVIRPK